MYTIKSHYTSHNYFSLTKSMARSFVSLRSDQYQYIPHLSFWCFMQYNSITDCVIKTFHHSFLALCGLSLQYLCKAVCCSVVKDCMFLLPLILFDISTIFCSCHGIWCNPIAVHWGMHKLAGSCHANRYNNSESGKPGVDFCIETSSWFVGKPGPLFNLKMLSHQYRKPHCGDKMAMRLSFLHNGNESASNNFQLNLNQDTIW